MHALDLLAWVGAAISWWGTARYMISIYGGETQPRLASWIAWGTANGVLMAVALMHGATVAAIFNGLAALGNAGVLVLCAAKRAGERPQGLTDWVCLGTSGACLVAILAFPGHMLADAVLAMAANIVATWPTIQHAWRQPREEAWQLFAANGGANALGLTSVFMSAGAGLSNIAGPLISMTGNVGLVLITVGRTWLTRTVQQVEDTIDVAEEALEDAFEEIAEDVTQEVAADAALLHQTFARPLRIPQAAPLSNSGMHIASPPTRPAPARQHKPRLIRTY